MVFTIPSWILFARLKTKLHHQMEIHAVAQCKELEIHLTILIL